MVYLLERVRTSAEERVVGCYAICPTLVVRDDLPKSLSGDKDHKWGVQLLREALEKIVTNVDLGDGQIIVVDAENTGLIVWLSPQGFKSTGGQELRLYVKVATATKSPSGNLSAVESPPFDRHNRLTFRCAPTTTAPVLMWTSRPAPSSGACVPRLSVRICARSSTLARRDRSIRLPRLGSTDAYACQGSWRVSHVAGPASPDGAARRTGARAHRITDVRKGSAIRSTGVRHLITGQTVRQPA